MAKWRTIRAKFTDEERNIILKYKRRHKIRSISKVVRLAIEDLIGLSIADRERAPLTTPSEYSKVYNFAEGYRKLIRSPEERKIFGEYFNQWDKKFWRDHTTEINKKLQKANKVWSAFKEHKRVGRPKEPAKKRGRSKYTGNQ